MQTPIGEDPALIDLHLHSHYSDGSDPPARVVELAVAAGLTAIALTDHDTMSGLHEAKTRANELGLGFITGVELSCHTGSRNVHLLGYGIDPANSRFGELLLTQQAARSERNVLLAARLSELGLEIDLDEVVALAGPDSVGRPHFAAILMRCGHVSSIDEAFARYLGDGRPAFIERRELRAPDAIRSIHEAGGIASWAHPFPRRSAATDVSSIEGDLEELSDAGLDALEAWYGRYESDVRRRLRRLASRSGLLVTGGSDYHGTFKPDLHVGIGLGDLAVPDEVIDLIMSRRNRL